jgi:hypothetical protein
MTAATTAAARQQRKIIDLPMISGEGNCHTS